jgi:hypothetical protein
VIRKTRQTLEFARSKIDLLQSASPRIASLRSDLRTMSATLAAQERAAAREEARFSKLHGEARTTISRCVAANRRALRRIRHQSNL